MSFYTHYTSTILPAVQKKLALKNILACPLVEKIILNMGIGTYVRAVGKDYSSLVNDLSLIAGQKPIVVHAKKSVSNFKLRQGMPVGLIVTLRGEKMFYFLEKLVNVVLPRVRDFRGVSKKSFDLDGNYNLWIVEHTIFPEVPQLDVVRPHGIQVTIRTKTQQRKHAQVLFAEMWFPFKA